MYGGTAKPWLDAKLKKNTCKIFQQMFAFFNT